MNTHHCLPLHIIIVSLSTDLESEISANQECPEWISPSCVSSYVALLSLWHWTCHMTHFDQLDKWCKQMAYICALGATLLECCRHVKKSVELCCWPDNQHQDANKWVGATWPVQPCIIFLGTGWVNSKTTCPTEPCPSSWPVESWGSGWLLSWGGEQTFLKGPDGT